MEYVRRCLAVVAIAACVAPVSADVIFSNVVVDGSLSSGIVIGTGPSDIDFLFPNATVGDPVHPLRAGTISITFEAQSDSELGILCDNLNVLGALGGSGKIFINEVVEDLVGFGVIGTFNALLDSNDDLPFEGVIEFDRPSTHIKVKKTFVLSAVDTPELDLASLALIEQNFRVPEPSLAVPALVVTALLLRRR